MNWRDGKFSKPTESKIFEFLHGDGDGKENYFTS